MFTLSYPSKCQFTRDEHKITSLILAHHQREMVSQMNWALLDTALIELSITCCTYLTLQIVINIFENR